MTKENETMQEYIERLLKEGLVNENLEPVKCPCGSTDYMDKETEHVENIVTEQKRYCKKCGKLMGSWSYGNWIP